MCIIAAKPAGVPMPSESIIRNMWDGNRDGAGIMYVENGKVRIEKGFMKYKSFLAMLDELRTRLDLTATPLVMHFRITTHGGTSPENTHPFPITDNIGALKKLSARCDIGVAHNGIIPISPRKGISDTMEYIASQLAPLKRAMPNFYTNKHALQLVENAIESRMAFLTSGGRIVTVGNFIEDEGVLYSNTSYMALRAAYRSLCYDSYWDEDKDWFAYACGATDSPISDTAEGGMEVRMLMWLDDGDYVKFPEGEMEDGCDYLIDSDHHVWWYDYEADCAVLLEGCTAYTHNGVPARYDEDLADQTVVWG